MLTLQEEGFDTSGYHQPVAVYKEGYKRVIAVTGSFEKDGDLFTKLIFFANELGYAIAINDNDAHDTITSIESSPITAEDWAHDYQDTHMETSVFGTTTNTANKTFVGLQYEEF